MVVYLSKRIFLVRDHHHQSQSQCGDDNRHVVLFRTTLWLWIMVSILILSSIFYNTRLLDGGATFDSVMADVDDGGNHNNNNNPAISSATSSMQSISLHDRQNENKNTAIDNSSNNHPTLALLYPPPLIGGYRNQAIRFFSLVFHAIRNHYTQLLLPTIVWSTRYSDTDDNNDNQNNDQSHFRELFWPVPMQELFDIQHWNSYHKSLPRLVDSISNSDCWNDTILSKQQQDTIRQRLVLENQKSNSASVPNTNLNNNHHKTSKNDIDDVHDDVVMDFQLPDLTLDIAPTMLRLWPLADSMSQYLTGNIPNVRKLANLTRLIRHCRHPTVYGGGEGGE
jgi:hypothetical protein